MGIYYDYESVARETGLGDAELAGLVSRWREDYNDDLPLLELRLLRVCMAIREGACTLEEALERESPVSRFGGNE